MDILSLLQYTFGKVVETFSHNWWLLLISILISARWRVISIVIGRLWVGSILLSFAYNLFFTW